MFSAGPVTDQGNRSGLKGLSTAARAALTRTQSAAVGKQPATDAGSARLSAMLTALADTATPADHAGYCPNLNSAVADLKRLAQHRHRQFPAG